MAYESSLEPSREQKPFAHAPEEGGAVAPEGEEARRTMPELDEDVRLLRDKLTGRLAKDLSMDRGGHEAERAKLQDARKQAQLDGHHGDITPEEARQRIDAIDDELRKLGGSP